MFDYHIVNVKRRETGIDVFKRWATASTAFILAMLLMVWPAFADEQSDGDDENEEPQEQTTDYDIINIDELINASVDEAVELVDEWDSLEGQYVVFAIGSSEDTIAYMLDYQRFEEAELEDGSWVVVLTRMSRSQEQVMTYDDLAEGKKIASATCYVLLDHNLSCEEADQVLQEMFDVLHIVAYKRTEKSNVTGTFKSTTGYGTFALAPYENNGWYVLSVTFTTPNIGDMWYGAEKTLFERMYSGKGMTQVYAMVKR